MSMQIFLCKTIRRVMSSGEKNLTMMGVPGKLGNSKALFTRMKNVNPILKELLGT